MLHIFYTSPEIVMIINDKHVVGRHRKHNKTNASWAIKNVCAVTYPDVYIYIYIATLAKWKQKIEIIRIYDLNS